MEGYFWSNTIWYLLLLATSIASVIVTMYKAPDRKFTVAFLLSVVGFSYWIEVILLLVLNAYTYRPMLTPGDPFQDAILGNFFSQISVSTTAVLFSVLELPGVFMLVFAGAYFLVDVLFVQLGIYTHHWYQSIFTLIGYIPYCWIVRRWYISLSRVPYKPETAGSYAPKVMHKGLRTVTLFLAVFAAAGKSFLTTQKLAGLQVLRGGFSSDITRDHTITALIFGPALVILCIVLHRLKLRRIYKGITLIALIICLWGLYMSGVLTAKPGWFIFAAVLDVFGYYFWTVLMERLLDSG